MSEQSQDHVEVSVIIPTYNRKDSVLRTLDSLSQQTFPGERFEVIVVDDGGSDGTAEIAQLTFPFALHYIRQENQGEIVARNAGVQRSAGKMLVFLDDDIEVNPEYLAAIATVHAAYSPAVVLAVLVEVAAGLPGDAVAKKPLPAAHREYQRHVVPKSVSFIECMSGIMSISRDGFFEIREMQPLLSGEGRNIWGGIDFGFRAHQHGFTFWRAQNAIAYHHDNTLASLESRCRRNYRVSYAVHHLFTKYPTLQGQIPMYHDKGPIEWRQDPPALIGRKLARQVVSSTPVMQIMERAVPPLEDHAPASKLLVLFQRWIISGYIYRGYQKGVQAVSGGVAS